MSHMYIESNNNKAYSLEYMACADEDKALKNPKHFFKYFDYVESVTTSQGSMDGQNSGEKLVKNYAPTTWVWNGCNIPSHSHIIYCRVMGPKIYVGPCPRTFNGSRTDKQ